MFRTLKIRRDIAMAKIIKTILLLFLLIGLAACGIGNLRLIVQFGMINGLESGDRIIHQNKYIGDVEEITRNTQGHYLVELDIDSDYKDQLTVYSIFYIDDDPDEPGRKAVFTEQKRPGGILLNDNSVVAGLDHPPYLRNMLDDLRTKVDELANDLADKIGEATESYQDKSTELARGLDESLAEIEKRLQELEKAIRTAPNSTEAKKLKNNVDKLLSDLETTMEKVKTTISRDLFNSLQKSLDEMHRRLDELNDEDNPSPEQEELIEEEII